MRRDSLQSVVQYLHRIIDVGPGAASDADLLERFATNRDEDAFALLVYRHGPMILGVCQRVLRHEHDAEDVFQATFLTLARRANSISKKDSLASWLYKVAFRIACRARGKTPMLTNQASLQAESEPDADVIWRDLRPILDQEIAQLRETYRVPIVLCYLEGKTHEEAAELLGWPKGTLAARLARGRERLRQRLTRRGWTLSAAVLATVLADKASAAAISAELMRTTVQAALAYVSGTTVAVLSAKAVALAEGVMQMMWYSKVKMAVVMLLAVVLSGSGVGWAMFAGGAGPEQAAQKQKAEPAGDAKAEMAAMRAEIAKLREELKAAIKEIKDLSETKLPKQPAEEEPTYKGKPLSVYLRQLKDRDAVTRGDAVWVIKEFAEEDKKLIPVLAAMLRDDAVFDAQGRQPPLTVGDVAREALQNLRRTKEVLPSVLVVLADNASLTGQRRAAELLAIHPSAVPQLVKALEDDLATANPGEANWELQNAIAKSLAKIGPRAKPAVPAVARLMEAWMQIIELQDKKNPEMFANFGNFYNQVNFADALLAMDPDLRNLLPAKTWKLLEEREPRPAGPRAKKEDSPPEQTAAEVDAAWRQFRAAMQKRFPKQK